MKYKIFEERIALLHFIYFAAFLFVCLFLSQILKYQTIKNKYGRQI